MTEPIDRTRAVRPGESLDLDRLADYLAEHVPELAGQPLELEQFPSGHSNLTYLLRAGPTEVVLRRPPFGANIKTAHDMGREFRIFAGLHPVFPKVPRPIHHCADTEVLGAEFYLMERIRGVILRAGSRGRPELPPELMQALSVNLVDNLADIHTVDLGAAGLDNLGKPEGYIRRQLEGWTRRWHAARTDDVPFVDTVLTWLDAEQPDDPGRGCLIHNDYKYDNVILDPDDLTRIIGVLDWEMATIGDPLMDLGTTLGYWITAADPPELQMFPFGPTTLAGNLSRSEVVARYAERSGLDVSGILFFYVQALFKIAVIAQQIYKRYKTGHSKDPRFAMFIEGVKLLFKTANAAIEAGRLEGFKW